MLSDDDFACLIGSMRKCRITRLEISDTRQRLRVVMPLRTPVTVSPLQSPTVGPNKALSVIERITVVSPSIGTFHRRGLDDGLPLLETGAHVQAGEILAYVCTGPLRVVLDAPQSGVLIDPGIQDGTVLGFGDSVFELEITA